MARNSEKAQSMLYRFREQQAAEMGMGNRRAGDRRPRIAASVSSLRDCERWRGDVLKEISRKVSKIQDVSLTDYEIRDLNDEINSLMREKRHWETQIVALGGANYKRAQASMTDDAGREVPGTRGYKYFGRAKDLPGVKELFARGAANANEESARNASFQMFRNQGPEYFGDMDEVDAELAAAEEAAAREAWAEAVAETAKILSIDEADIPYPVASTSTSSLAQSAFAQGQGQGQGQSSAPAGAPTAPAADLAQAQSQSQPQANGNGERSKSTGKRKANGQTQDAGETDTPDNAGATAGVDTNSAADAEADAGIDGADASKKARTEENVNGNGTGPTESAQQHAQVQAQAQAQASAFAQSFGGLFDPSSLVAPTLPSQEEMGNILLEVRKRALREEYGV